MHFEWLLARRYLRTGRRSFLSVITLIAIAAVATGVASLVLALAINAGFRQTFEQRLLGSTAHLSVTRTDVSGIRDYRQLATRLAALPGVTSVSPALYETVLLASASRAQGIVLKGLDPDHAHEFTSFLARLPEGSAEALRPAASQQPTPPLLVGRELANRLGLRVGDPVLVTSPQGHLTPFGLVPKYRSFELVGIFESGFYDFDAGWVYTSLAAAQQLFGLGDVVSILELRLTDVYAAENLVAEAQQAAGPAFVATPWTEHHRSLFRALRLEKLVTAIFIGLIVFVAGLNILILLVMLVLEKRRDIAVLVSFGARRAQIQRIFILHGLAIGALGTLLGLGVGYLAAWLAHTRQLIPLDPEIYGIPFVPFQAHPLDAIFIALAALAISFAAALYPARRAAALLPTEILRYE
ncbi:MAG: FtsX-like permease family protein [Terriglobia bacterium]